MPVFNPRTAKPGQTLCQINGLLRIAERTGRVVHGKRWIVFNPVCVICGRQGYFMASARRHKSPRRRCSP